MQGKIIDNTSIAYFSGMVLQSQSILSSALANEQLLRASVANAPFILYALDENGIFTLSEGKGLEDLGLKRGEVVGKSVFELYAAKPEILDYLRRSLAGEEMTWIVELNHKHYENSTTPLLNLTGQVMGVVGVASDINTHVQIEEQWRQLPAALEQAGDAIVITAIDLTPPGPTIVFANRA